MNAGVSNEAVLRRHLLALAAALTLLERRTKLELDAYLADQELQWSVERGLLLCVQNVLDIAVHLTASAGIDSPDYKSSIAGLARLGVLPQDFARALQPMASFRNVLVHAYLTVDPAIVHEVLTQRLPELRAFARHVEAYLERR